MKNMGLLEGELDEVYVGEEQIRKITKEVDDNLFMIHVLSLGDWKRVMFHNPWIFRRLMVLSEEFDGKHALESINLQRPSVWAQIHKIPNLYRKEPIVDQLARRIGMVRSAELNPTWYFEGNYVRVRASIDVSKLLICWTPMNLAGERIFLKIKYEKIC